MAEQANFTAECNLAEAYIEVLARYLSCNGEVIGIGPTLVFASAATLFLYSELGSTFMTISGDNVESGAMEKTLVITMLLGMLSLMIHMWVCSTRLFQYYMEAVVCESPMFLLEYTTGSLLGDKLDLIPVAPLTKFLRSQQTQIHITLCWFVALCYADYVRKNYCRRFNMPYLEQWQSRLHDRASRGVHQAIKSVNSFVGNLHDQLRSLTQAHQPPSQAQSLIQSPDNQAPPGPSPYQAPPGPFPYEAPPGPFPYQAAPGPSPYQAPPGPTPYQAPPGPSPYQAPPGPSPHRAPPGPSPSQQHPSSATSQANRPEPEKNNNSPATPSPQSPQQPFPDDNDTQQDALVRTRRSQKNLLQWAKVGESNVSEVPTLLWGLGAAALAHRLLNALFRRFLFRRVPLWEVMLQNLLFLWMVIYGLHFWMMLVKLTKFLVDYCYEFPHPLDEDFRTCYILQQWLVWAFGTAPLAFYVYTRPRPDAPPVLIWFEYIHFADCWITTNPWQRREMGPQGYYLTRPLSSLQSTTNTSLREEAIRLRRAFSDSKIIEKVPPKKKRYSKSV